MKGFSGAFLAISGMIYIMLITNVMIGVTCFPVWFFLLFTDLRASWLWLVVSSILLAPALWAAFGVFRDYSRDGSTSAIRTYLTQWSKSWRRIWPAAVGLATFFFLIGMDLYVTNLWGIAMATAPVAIVLTVLGLSTTLVAWVGLADREDLTRLTVIKASMYLAVRKPGWSLVSLAILSVVGYAIWMKPAIGLGLVLSPALYVVWSNSRRVFAPFLADSQLVKEEQ